MRSSRLDDSDASLLSESDMDVVGFGFASPPREQSDEEEPP